MAKNKRYTLKAKQNGQVKNYGYIDMKNQGGTAELYLYGDIVDDELAAAYFGGNCPQEIADFVAGLSPNQPLTIYFNSPGGDVFAGLAIYNVLKRHQGRKTGQVDGMAASIASVILMSCDERVVNTGAQVMIHDPFRTAITNIWTEIKNTVGGFVDGIASRLSGLGITFSDVTSALWAIWSGFCDLLAPIFEGVFQQVSNVLSVVCDVLLGLLDVFISIFKGDWSGAWDAVKGIFTAVWDYTQCRTL